MVFVVSEEYCIWPSVCAIEGIGCKGMKLASVSIMCLKNVTGVVNPTTSVIVATSASLIPSSLVMVELDSTGG